MNETITTIEGFARQSRKAAAEGIVLLKNINNVLPITKDDEIAVFGRCQIDYYRSGTGSGGSVNVPYKITAIDGLKNNKDININKNLSSIYRSFVDQNPFDNGGGGWAAEPWFQKEMLLTDKIVLESKSSSNKAVVIIGRTAGEEQDNKDTEGSYRLTELEMDMLVKVCKQYNNVIVILNVSNIIDMSWLDNDILKDSITGVLYSWHGGIEGGNALSDVLSGKVTPGGKLTDTIAYNLKDYPTDKNFGDEQKNYYMEDIYIGYRYFETFNKDAVRYPFGFGLSYTEFQMSTIKSEVQGSGLQTTFNVEVEVTNVGGVYSGKEVVQVYYSAPQGLLGKSVIELGAFLKTRVLKPGESQILSFNIPILKMSSYDDSGLTGNKSSYILEAGEYNIFVGNSIRNIHKVETYLMDNLEVVEHLQEALAPTDDFKRMKPGKQKDNGNFELIYEDTPKRQISLKDRIEKWLPTKITQTGDLGFKLKDVKDGKVTLESFVAQLTQSELETMVRGEGMSSPRVTSGTAGAFGGVGDNLAKYGIPVACCADGPSGIRRDSGEVAFQIPIGTLLACSWDVELMEELYIYEGKELVLNQIDSLLGPGMNIHRHPLNGRNFEYFSEDPYLTGCMAKATTLGLKKGGSTGTIKHFACNDQELKRTQVDSIVSERALREIHLKGFEIAVKEGEATSLMTAYNPINGIWTASNYDLNTTILRKEWGYKGIVMTDWWAKMNDPILGGVEDIKFTSYMVRAQNDIYMLANNYGAEVNGMGDNLSTSVDNGQLTIAELQQCATNICTFLLDSKVMDRELKKQEVKTIISRNSIKGEIVQSVSSEISLNTLVDKSTIIEVESNGIYSIVLDMRYKNFPSAQSSCNLLLNGDLITNIQLNGTNGRWIKEKNVNIQLEKGIYDLGIVFTKPGLELSDISFVLN